MDTSQAHRTIADVLATIAPEIDLGSIDGDAELQVDADLDSMDFLNLVEGVARALGRDIPERDYPRLSTLNGFADYLAGPS